MKKCCCFVLAALLVTALLGVGAEAKEALTFGDWKYVHQEESNEITIKKYTGNAKEISVPEQIDGIPVTSIGGSAFSRCSSLTDITIPDSVTSIGKSAFDGCDNLTVSVDGGSYAETYCIDNHINYVYHETLDWLYD